MNDVIFFKPNEIVAVIDQIQVNRLAKHLCNYFLKYAQSEIKFKDKQSSWFEFNINEVNELAQIRTKDYKLIEQSIEALMHPITVRDKDDPKKYLKLVLITAVGIDSTKGVYKYQLNDIMIDLLRNTDYFTKLNLQEMNPLESKHSLVIFEWLKRYENSPQIPSMSIEELRKITGTLDKKAYDNFTNLQTRVLNIAISEITKYTPYQVSYKAIKTRAKTRNKVTAIQFTFTKKPEVPSQPKIAQEDLCKQELIDLLTKPLSIDEDYRKLCSKFIYDNFCTTEEVFYELTYKYRLQELQTFYDAKKKYTKYTDKVSWLEKDDNKQSLLRRDYHTEYLDRLVNRVPERLQSYVNQYKHRLGFASLLVRLRQFLDENNPIEIDKYL